MCGIVAVVGSIMIKEEKAFKTLLELDTTRGHHSTGVLRVGSAKNDWETLKQIGTPWDLYKESDFTKLWAKSHKLLLGHNRWATKGKITADNAHPFHQGDFIGVHNGTLTNQSLLPDNKFFDVDSENIYHGFNINGVSKTISMLHGAFALAWYDDGNRTFQMVRNNERPLFYCFSQDTKTLFVASEAWMLHVALQKADIKYLAVREVEVGELYTVEIPLTWGSDLKHSKEKVEFFDPKKYWASQHKKKEEKTQEVKKESGLSVISSSKPLTNYFDKEVVFSVDSYVENSTQKYVKCTVEDNDAPELRIFVTKDKPLYKQLLDSVSFFKATIKSVVKSGNMSYLKVDHRTIVETDFEEGSLVDQSDDDSPKEFEGFKCMKLTAAQWYDRVSAGCEVCQRFPTPSQKDSLIWVGPEVHICAECAITYAGQEFLRTQAG